MEQEFVLYEEALAMKKLRFNDMCIATFINKQLKFHPNGTYQNHLDWKDNIAAPLYQQAFRWFREKYGVTDRYFPYAFGYNAFLDNTPEPKFWNKDWRYDFPDPFNTYEEAELACLQQLIKIVQDGRSN